MASLKAIAEKTNTSLATVSRALNDHAEVDPRTRQRVLQAAQDLGYVRPAERRLDSTVIGYMRTARPQFFDYDALLMRGLVQAGSEYRFDTMWLDLHRDKSESDSYARFFRNKNVRGVVVLAVGDSQHIVEAMADEGVPLVVIGEQFARPEINWLRISGVRESRRAVEHLLALGHRRIALVKYSRSTHDHADRELGYRQALQAAGVAIDESLIIPAPASAASGAAAINALLTLPVPPTAIYLTDPEATVGAINRCLELKVRIPEELSIVGFDDNGTRRMTWPHYSAVCQETSRLGFEAGRWLSRRLAGIAQPALQEEFEAHFEVLDTTGVVTPRPVRVLPDGTRLQVETVA